MPEIPYTIRTILAGLKPGLGGAVVYCGGSQLTYSHPPTDRDRECRPSQRSHVTPEGCIHNEVGLTFAVNGKRGEAWKISIAYEADDTFTVRLWKATRRPKGPALLEAMRGGTLTIGEVINTHEDVYIGELQHAVEAMYDLAIKERCAGFIPC